MSELTVQRPFAETIYDDGVISVAHVALNGLGPAIRNSISTIEYQVLSGEGNMVVGGRRHALYIGSSVVVPAGITYQDKGSVDMLATSTPPFDIENVEILQASGSDTLERGQPQLSYANKLDFINFGKYESYYGSSIAGNAWGILERLYVYKQGMAEKKRLFAAGTPSLHPAEIPIVFNRGLQDGVRDWWRHRDDIGELDLESLRHLIDRVQDNVRYNTLGKIRHDNGIRNVLGDNAGLAVTNFYADFLTVNGIETPRIRMHKR